MIYMDSMTVFQDKMQKRLYSTVDDKFAYLLM
jgi:hypothetical protein